MKQYRIGDVLGSGGMGEVIAAWRPNPDGTETAVALKRLPPDKPDRDLAYRLLREAKLGIELAGKHPCLVRVLDIDRDERQLPMIVMERIDGVSLQRLRVAPVPYEAVRAIVVAILEALEVVHAHGAIHRDVSPRNIMVSRGGEIKLIDFGVARRMDGPLTEPGFKGVPAYASPEALESPVVTPCTDLYSLAAVAYELLTGASPFGVGLPVQILSRIRMGRLVPLPDEVPGDLREVITGLLTFRQERRYTTAAELLAVLRDRGQPHASAEELAALVMHAEEHENATLGQDPAQPAEKPRYVQPGQPVQLAQRSQHSADCEPHRTHDRLPRVRTQAPIRRRSPAGLALAAALVFTGAVVGGISGARLLDTLRDNQAVQEPVTTRSRFRWIAEETSGCASCARAPDLASQDAPALPTDGMVRERSRTLPTSTMQTASDASESPAGGPEASVSVKPQLSAVRASRAATVGQLDTVQARHAKLGRLD